VISHETAGIPGTKIYINGNLVNDLPYSGTPSSTTDTLAIGAYTNSVYALGAEMADFRVYATALSDVDALSLYEQKASVDDMGNLFINEINLPKSYTLIEEQTKFMSDSTYKSIGTFTLIDTNILDFLESDSTLGNTVVTADIYCSSAVYYPTSFEYTKDNNTKGFKNT